MRGTVERSRTKGKDEKNGNDKRKKWNQREIEEKGKRKRGNLKVKKERR